MRNLRLLAMSDEIEAHVDGLWRTDLFRAEARRDGSLLQAVLGLFAGKPRVFADLSEPGIEASHFSAWFGVVCHRDWYGNPYVSDLYYLHEITHAATLGHGSARDWEAWRLGMIENEFQVSMLTEALVYLDIPELRERSFEGEIWADRFLGPEGRAEYAGKGRRAHVARITQWRRRAMAGDFPKDCLAVQLATYASQNMAWAEVWRDRWREVEDHMVAFRALANGSGRREALRAHASWLEAKSERSVPFRQEAEAFAAIYHANKTRSAG